MFPSARRALVVRIGALGDLLLTRRLTYSLFLAGFRTTLFGPVRHGSLLLADPWIDGVLDSESPSAAAAFSGMWPTEFGVFDAAIVISNAGGVSASARAAAPPHFIQVAPIPTNEGAPIACQWTEGAREICGPFGGALPLLPTDPGRCTEKGLTIVHPGSGSPSKNWPIGRFAELATKLKNRGHAVAWLRGPAESVFPESVGDARVIDRPSLDTLAATLAHSRVFIGNDSGVSHLAAAVGAPTVAIFGPTSDVVWRPDGPQVRTIRASSGLLTDIAVDEVSGAIDALLEASRKPLP